MTLALPNGLARLPHHLKSLLSSSTSTLKAFSTSLTTDREETPAMKALKDIPYPSVSPDPSIFESWSDEYTSAPLPRSTRLAEKKPAIQALKDIPYPSVSPDSSIFESWSDEYTTVSFPHSARLAEKPEPTQGTGRGHHPSALLERLSWLGKFAEAEEVREELVGMGVPIRHSSVYSVLAWNVLRRRPWPQNRAELFANWLSLMPDVTENKKLSHVYLLKSALLFSSSDLDLESVAHFGVILSSKGYIRMLGASVASCLTRYAEPEISSRVVDQMIAADDDYRRKMLGFTKRTDTRFRDTSKRLWSVVIRTHCTLGRPKVAYQVAIRIHERGISLTQYTYQYLIRKLQTDGLHELAADIQAFPGCTSDDVAKSRFITKDTPTLEPIPPISRDLSPSANESTVLSILKQSSLLGLPTYATDIVPYFDIYKTGVRGGPEVIKLRSQAYQVSLAAVSRVLLAELLHHHRRGQFIHVLWIFEKFFHIAGVPASEVARHLWRRDHYPAHIRIHKSLPNRITKTTFNLPSKLWPMAYHTALVWTALVQLCKNGEEVSMLYDQLLQRCAGLSRPSLRHNNSAGGGLDGFSHGDRYDAAHFRPFLVAITLLRGAAEGLRVIDHMQEHGIAPSARIIGTGAALQARYGEPAIALRMLGVMHEVLEKRDADANTDVDADADADADMGLDLKAELAQRRRTRTELLLIIAYTTVLRGFIDRRTLVPARHVAEMLNEKFGYQIDGNGSGNPRTNALLRFLRRLEMEGPSAQPEPGDAAILVRAVDAWKQERYSYPFLKNNRQVCSR